MKKILLSSFLFTLLIGGMQGQNRYLDPVFGDVTISLNQTYGANIDVLQMALIELKTDVYVPTGDTETNRPAVLLSHTGSFIPRVVNQAATGFKDDSVIVEVATRLAKRGYVVFAYTYRQGWLPTAVDDNTRKGTLLQAAYRGIQDTRTLARFIRKTIAEEGNPFGVDGSRIAAWGVGTGGYLSFGAATLDDFQEVVLPKFINTSTLLPYVDTTVIGNFDGTSMTAQCIPNHVGYNSDIQMAVNMGGALGDVSWLDGDMSSNEPPMVGFHCPTDIFAPYYIGPVIVPGPNFVVLDEASGTREAIGVANGFDLNTSLETIPADKDPLRARIDAYAQQDVVIGGEAIKLGTDNFYPFVGLTPGAGSPWDWWNFNVLQARVAGINMALGTNYSADTIHLSGLLTNPDMSGTKAKAYIDTIFMVTAPRLCAGLGLDCGFSGIDQIEAIEVSFAMSPNPAFDYVRFSSDTDNPMQKLTVYNSAGKVVAMIDRIDASQYEFRANELPPGMYYAAVLFEKGTVLQKLSVVQ
jgi:hypothetical protein